MTTMAINGKVDGNKLVLTIDLAETPYISTSETKKAEKEGRTAVARMLASTGGFTAIGNVSVSLNVMKR
jgi:hypothetical protein